MAKVYFAPTRDAIVLLIMEYGPMTSTQLADRLQRNQKSIDSAIRTGRKTGARWLFIIDYDRHFGLQGKPAPIYAVGCFPDCPRPVPDRNANRERYRSKFSPEQWREIVRERVSRSRKRRTHSPQGETNERNAKTG